MQLVIVGEENWLNIPPPESLAELPERCSWSASARSRCCTSRRRTSAELPEKVQLVTVGEEELKLYIPPPRSAELPEKVQLVTVGEEPDVVHPAARIASRVAREGAVGHRRRGGAVVASRRPQVAELPEKVQLVTVGEESSLYIPPPEPPAELPEKVQLVTVGEEEPLHIPPPCLGRVAREGAVGHRRRGGVVVHPAADSWPSCPRRCSWSPSARSRRCTSRRRSIGQQRRRSRCRR